MKNLLITWWGLRLDLESETEELRAVEQVDELDRLNITVQIYAVYNWLGWSVDIFI